MKKFTPMRRYLIPILTFLFLITVTVVEAKGLVPCGGEGEDKCQMCHFVQLGQRILEWFILVSASIIAVMFAWGGFEWVMSGGNTGKIQKGKDKMINALIGLLIILGAYLVVNTIMVTFVDQSVVSNWSSIQCVQQPSRTGGGGSNPGSQPGGTNPTTPAAGTCNPATSGACSPEALSGTFGSAASQASQICMAESGGNPATLSKTDKTLDGNSFSVGLYQINLTYHKITCGGKTLDCPSAFQGKNYTAKVTNTDLYNQCVSAAQDATCNTNKAKEIYSQSKDSWRQWSTGKKCNLI